MQPGHDDRFIPASTIPEAIFRIFALTGRAPDGTRGEKRALLALRDALGLDVETVRTNATLGRALAESLHVEWDAARFTERNTVTLHGLNALLAAAAEARRAGSLRRLRDAAPDTLAGHEWASFRPARSKIEAVTRIAALTDAPKEWLGPGGKEHKSVLLNLADTLFPHDRIDRSSKTRLGASLAAALGVAWNDRCESTGYTISLAGLNTVLAGAERHLGLLGSEVADALHTPADEGAALTAALLDGLPTDWDGRRAVTWLVEQRLRGAHDNEWQGFYGEEMAKVVLGRSFTPRADPPVMRYGNTVFDYALNWVWDIKIHTEVQIVSGGAQRASDETLLNDAVAIRRCVDDQGLGFLIVSGAGLMDEDVRVPRVASSVQDPARQNFRAFALRPQRTQGGLPADVRRGVLARQLPRAGRRPVRRRPSRTLSTSSDHGARCGFGQPVGPGPAGGCGEDESYPSSEITSASCGPLPRRGPHHHPGSSNRPCGCRPAPEGRPARTVSPPARPGPPG